MADHDHEKSDLDLTAWAAYVFGHHAWTLQLWQDAFWDAHCFRIPECQDADPRRLDFQLCELTKARVILAVAEQLTAAMATFLDIFSLTERRLTMMIEAHEAGLPDLPLVWPYLWESLPRLADKAISPESADYRWFALGQSVGRCQFLARTQLVVADYEQSVSADESVPRIMDRCLKRFDLTKRGAFSGELRDAIHSISISDEPKRDAGAHAYFSHLARRYRNINRLDAEFQAWLQQQQAPTLLLVFDKDFIEFFEQRIRIKQCSQEQIRLLLRLAETPGVLVARDAFNKDCNIDKPTTLRSTVSRLKDKILRPALQKYKEKHGLEEAPGGTDAFIRAGGRDKSPLGWTEYMLDLAPAQVKVNRRDLDYRK
jgi:hypothetical protein